MPPIPALDFLSSDTFLCIFVIFVVVIVIVVVVDDNVVANADCDIVINQNAFVLTLNYKWQFPVQLMFLREPYISPSQIDFGFGQPHKRNCRG